MKDFHKRILEFAFEKYSKDSINGFKAEKCGYFTQNDLCNLLNNINESKMFYFLFELIEMGFIIKKITKINHQTSFKITKEGFNLFCKIKVLKEKSEISSLGIFGIRNDDLFKPHYEDAIDF
jgi:hypothetical protein